MDPILLHADSYHGSASRLDEGQLRSASLEGTLTTRASFEGVGCASSFLRSLLGSLLRGGLLARLLNAHVLVHHALARIFAHEIPFGRLAERVDDQVGLAVLQVDRLLLGRRAAGVIRGP